MKNIANADRPKSAGAMLPPRPLRRSGKVAQTACNSDRREGNSCIPTLNQTFADSRILKISKFPTFRIAGRKLLVLPARSKPANEARRSDVFSQGIRPNRAAALRTPDGPFFLPEIGEWVKIPFFGIRSPPPLTRRALRR